MHKKSFYPKKKFGQNFLIDQNIAKKIVSLASLSKNSLVIEIGPGLGGITKYLISSSSKVVAFEIDKQLIPILKNKFSCYKNFFLVHDDFLQHDLVKNKIIKSFISKEIKVVANLAYNIASQVIIKILKSKLNIKSFVLMLQKEFAERITAQPNTKKYNSFSIFVQHHCAPKIIFDVPNHVFWPAPKVTSSLVYFEIKNPSTLIFDEEAFFSFVKAMFVQRRKTILNNLINFLVDKELAIKVLNSAKIASNLRAENLTKHDFLTLFKALKD